LIWISVPGLLQKLDIKNCLCKCEKNYIVLTHSSSKPNSTGINAFLASLGFVESTKFPWFCSVRWMPGWRDWLAEISADLREAVAH